MKAHPEQCLEVRYEDLVRESGAQMQRLCEFLGIDFDEEMTSRMSHTSEMGDLHAYEHYSKVLEPVSGQNIGLGRSKLSASELQRVAQEIGETMQLMGYPI